MRRARPSPTERASPSTDWRCRWAAPILRKDIVQQVGRPVADGPAAPLRSTHYGFDSSALSVFRVYPASPPVRSLTAAAALTSAAPGAEPCARDAVCTPTAQKPLPGEHPCRIRFRNGACPGRALHGDGPAAVQPGRPAAVSPSPTSMASPPRCQLVSSDRERRSSPHLFHRTQRIATDGDSLTARQEHQRPRPHSYQVRMPRHANPSTPRRAVRSDRTPPGHQSGWSVLNGRS